MLRVPRNIATSGICTEVRVSVPRLRVKRLLFCDIQQGIIHVIMAGQTHECQSQVKPKSSSRSSWESRTRTGESLSLSLSSSLCLLLSSFSYIHHPSTTSSMLRHYSNDTFAHLPAPAGLLSPTTFSNFMALVTSLPLLSDFYFLSLILVPDLLTTVANWLCTAKI